MSDAYTSVVIVGAGPVGLATAIGCARRGLSVRVLDRSEPPIDKACGEGIMPDGVERLRGLGIDAAALGGRRFRGIRYVGDGVEAVARFRRAPGVGLRRTRLQRALVDGARAAGARLDFGRTVRALLSRGVATDGGDLTADVVVGADGLRSRVRKWAGLDRGPHGSRFGVRRHYRSTPWTDLVEVHWADRAEAYVTPVGETEVGVALLADGLRGDFRELLRRFPLLEERLRHAEIVSRDLGVGPLERRVAAVARGRVALVGDAAGYVDAITGEGLTAGLAQAEALADALAAGSLARYARAHRRIQRVPELLMRSLLAIERRPRLRRRMLRTLAADPILFERLLEVHTGERKVSRLGLRTFAGMGRLLLAD